MNSKSIIIIGIVQMKDNKNFSLKNTKNILIRIVNGF